MLLLGLDAVLLGGALLVSCLVVAALLPALMVGEIGRASCRERV